MLKPPTMRKLNITLPTGWGELTDKQLRYVIDLTAHGFTPDQVKLCLLMRLNDLQAVRNVGSAEWLFRHHGRTISVDTLQLHSALAALSWIDTPPTDPIRPLRMGRAAAIDAQLHGCPFSTYLKLVNLYQGYIMSRNTAAATRMAEILYPGLHLPKDLAPLHTAVVWWVAALQQLFARHFTHLFAPSGSDETHTPDPERTMNTMLAALTAGDITKEAEVLSSDTWRALTYLDRMAEETAKLKH